MSRLTDTVRGVWQAFRQFLTRLLVLPIRLYQRLISPLFPPRCRYTPSCSQYAIEALRKHGPLKGLWLAVYRIVRCNPFGGFGYDPYFYIDENKTMAELTLAEKDAISHRGKALRKMAVQLSSYFREKSEPHS